MARTFNLNAQCHCGTISQPIRSPPIDDLAHDFRAQESSPKKVQLCHCTSCRLSTGNLYTSYYPFSPPKLENTTAYPPIPINPDRPNKISQRHFCSTCGCHIFRSIFDKQRVKYSDVKLKNVEFSNHVFVGDTKDGGAAVWLRETYRGPLIVYAHAGRDYYTGQFPLRITFSKQKHRYPHLPLLGDDQLKASCLCKAVQFHITRPTSSLQIVSPNIPDFLKGEKEEKEGRWWLRENGTKYLAGLCACRTCRLTSGFEIQPWAYVPRANISFNSPSQHASTGEEATTSTLLNLEALSAGIFTTYETSLNHTRTFCKTCGATVFAYEKTAPDLIRVSVGLFSAKEGARAENWLSWYTSRIGFQEQAVIGRPEKDEPLHFQNDVVDCFSRDLKAWGKGLCGRGKIVGGKEVSRRYWRVER